MTCECWAGVSRGVGGWVEGVWQGWGEGEEAGAGVALGQWPPQTSGKGGFRLHLKG